MFTQPGLNVGKAIWMAFLSELNFEVNNIKGRENRVVDALSHRTHEVYGITMSQPKIHLRRRIQKTSIHDVEYENLLNKLLKYKVNLNETEFKVYQKGLILYKGRIYMPNIANLKLVLLNEMHRTPYVGNPGYQKMITTLEK